MSGFGLSGRLYTSRDKRSGVHVARPLPIPPGPPQGAWWVAGKATRRVGGAAGRSTSILRGASHTGFDFNDSPPGGFRRAASALRISGVSCAHRSSRRGHRCLRRLPNIAFPLPRVAGSYIGDVTISARSLGVVSVSGINRMEATQSGNQVTIGGVFAAIGEGIETPSITGTINETGVFTPTAGAGATLGSGPSCGTWMLASAAISFSGRSMQIQETMETDRCGVIRLSGTLARRG